MNTITQAEFEESIPEWISCNGEIDFDILENIRHGGCASGAYMPAVTYYTAAQTMAEHGDDVLSYIYDAYGEMVPPDEQESWGGIAVHYLSMAVELWCLSHEDTEIEEESDND